MRFFDFLESKFTHHSITQQTKFSAISDGEQKATQSYLWFVRLLCKLWAMIKLPTEFLLCKLNILKFPAPAPEILERLVRESKAKADQMKKDHDLGQEKVTPIRPALDSRPCDLQ